MVKKAIALFLCFASCHPPFTDHAAYLGADDLIMDSYALSSESCSPDCTKMVTVTGEVQRRGEIALQGFTAPLRDVLQEAGGLTAFGSPLKIFIFREGTSGVRLYALSWEHIVTLPKKSLLVQQGDIVCVGAKPLFRIAGGSP